MCYSLFRRQSSFPLWAFLLATPVLLLSSGLTPAQQPPEDPGYEELTSGPIHEAYADVVALQPTPGPIISREPPQPINELPPEQRPEGNRVEWLPGYWLWDVDREDFVWISGVYRNIPPNRRWVPGSWVAADGGWQRVSGFWADVELTSIDYLPNPPDSLENGPTSPAPTDNHFWVPGCWYWQQSDYAWRPGYWSAGYNNWVWMPHRYVWTPRGCIWINGYWDFLPVRRGLLFAPVYFHQPIYARANYYYRPGVVWNAASYIASWFVRPLDCHYYYGNYYGSSFANYGYLPWYSFYRTRGFYDPLYSWYRWDYRQRPFGRWNNWDSYVQDRFHYYRDNERARPPVTFAELNRRGPDGWRDEFSRGDRSRNDSDRIAARLDDYRGRGPGDVRLERVSDQMRDQMAERTQRWRAMQQQRTTNEGLAGPQNADRPAGPSADRGSLQLPNVFSPGERAARVSAANRQQALSRGDDGRTRDFRDRAGLEQFNQRGQGSTNFDQRRVETLRPNLQQGDRPTLDRPGLGDQSQPNVQVPQFRSRNGPSLRAPQIEQRIAPQRQFDRGSPGSIPTYRRPEGLIRPNTGNQSLPNLQRSTPQQRPGGSLRAPQIEQRLAPQRQSLPSSRGASPSFNFNRGAPGGSVQPRSGSSLQRNLPSFQRSPTTPQRIGPSPSPQRSGGPSSRGGGFVPGRSGGGLNADRGGGNRGRRGGPS